MSSFMCYGGLEMTQHENSKAMYLDNVIEHEK